MGHQRLFTLSVKQLDSIGNGNVDDLIMNLIKLISKANDNAVDYVKGPYKNPEGDKLFVINFNNKEKV